MDIVIGSIIGMIVTRVWIHFENRRHAWKCPEGDLHIQAPQKETIEYLKRKHFEAYPDHDVSQ